MAKPIEGIRGAILTNELLQKLKEYLRFRHLFRHIYGFVLKWERFKNLCTTMPEIFEEIKHNLKTFLVKKMIEKFIKWLAKVFGMSFEPPC